MADEAAGRIVLLSIHPRHAEAILRGEKRVELRRAPIAANTTHVLLYATSPVRAVIGWFEVLGIDEASMTAIWNKYGSVSGISRSEHRSYFKGATRAFAIRVARPKRLSPVLSLAELPGVTRPPQSFQYVDAQSSAWIFETEE